MPNWFSDDDDGYTTCPYCGFREAIEVGPSYHFCEGMRKAHEEENRKFEADFKGKGRIKGVLTIEYECYDSEMAFNNLMDIVSLNTDFKNGKGEDDVLECKWKVTHSKEKIKK